MHLSRDEITRLSPDERLISPDERLTLIAALWDSLDDADVPVTAAQQAELDRRLATLDYDKGEAVSWDALRAELERRCP